MNSFWIAVITVPQLLGGAVSQTVQPFNRYSTHAECMEAEKDSYVTAWVNQGGRYREVAFAGARCVKFEFVK